MEACDLASAAMNIRGSAPSLQTAKMLPKIKVVPDKIRN